MMRPTHGCIVLLKGADLPCVGVYDAAIEELGEGNRYWLWQQWPDSWVQSCSSACCTTDRLVRVCARMCLHTHWIQMRLKDPFLWKYSSYLQELENQSYMELLDWILIILMVWKFLEPVVELKYTNSSKDLTWINLSLNTNSCHWGV